MFGRMGHDFGNMHRQTFSSSSSGSGGRNVIRSVSTSTSTVIGPDGKRVTKTTRTVRHPDGRVETTTNETESLEDIRRDRRRGGSSGGGHLLGDRSRW